MPTLEENVNRVKAAKTAIGNAITAKGGTVGANDGLEEFASDIATIPSGGVEFSNSPANFTLLKNIQNLDVIIPSGVGSIYDDAFRGCTGLTSVISSNTVTSIGTNAFSESGLINIELNEGLLTIGGSAFYKCSGLTSIEIPSTVTSIGTNGFRFCTGLQSIKFKSLTPPTLGNSSAFGSLQTSCKIYVPTGTLSDYTSASYYPDSSTYTYVEY